VNIADIKRLLPHRYPMLLIDQILDVVPGESLVATKAVTSNEPWYAGLPDSCDHAYPAVLLAESWCQAAGVLICLGEPNPDVLVGKVTLFGSISGLRLLRPVYPGDLLRHTVRLVRAVSDAAMLTGEATVGGVPVMEVDSIVIALREAAGLRAPAAPAQTAVPRERVSHG
jgi:3-hydroxyacyl-[acyl-carrier-protein] dehydratase